MVEVGEDDRAGFRRRNRQWQEAKRLFRLLLRGVFLRDCDCGCASATAASRFRFETLRKFSWDGGHHRLDIDRLPAAVEAVSVRALDAESHEAAGVEKIDGARCRRRRRRHQQVRIASMTGVRKQARERQLLLRSRCVHPVQAVQVRREKNLPFSRRIGLIGEQVHLAQGSRVP